MNIRTIVAGAAIVGAIAAVPANAESIYARHGLVVSVNSPGRIGPTTVSGWASIQRRSGQNTATYRMSLIRFRPGGTSTVVKRVGGNYSLANTGPSAINVQYTGVRTTQVYRYYTVILVTIRNAQGRPIDFKQLVSVSSTAHRIR